MSEEVSIHGGVVRVTDASIVGHSIYNRVKAEDRQKRLSVHFQTDGITAPGPREALLVSIVSGINPRWLQISDGPEEPGPVDIHFQADSTEKFDPHMDDGSRAAQHDVFHMTEVARGNRTRLHLAMTDKSSHTVHADVVLNKYQVTQMIASLLVLYSRLHED